MMTFQLAHLSDPRIPKFFSKHQPALATPGGILGRTAGWQDPTSDLAVADGCFSQQLGAVVRVAPNRGIEGLDFSKNGEGNESVIPRIS